MSYFVELKYKLVANELLLLLLLSPTITKEIVNVIINETEIIIFKYL